MLTDRAIQTIADVCRIGGYNFTLALRTAVRDGVPWYVSESRARRL